MKMLDFGEAVRKLGEGERIARKGWNGKNMHLFQLNGGNLRGTVKGKDIDIVLRPCIIMCGVDGTYSTWSPATNDTLAADWYVVQDRKYALYDTVFDPSSDSGAG